VTALQIVQLLDLAVQVAQQAGVSMARYNAMRESSASGRLTPEQLQQLADDARRSLDKL
jgi:hypothetical protein